MRRMNFWQKLLGIFIQVGLIFFSAFVNLFAWGLLSAPIAYVAEEAFLEKWKNFEAAEGTYYRYEDPSYKVKEDLFGNIKVVYDDGRSYETSADEKAIAAIIFFALLLRCISLLLSILALIIPPLNIKVKNNLNSRANIALDLYWY